MDKEISDLLRETKEKTGWSEIRLAQELRVSQPTVNRILNGQNDCKGSTMRAIQALHTEAHRDSEPQDSLPSTDSPTDEERRQADRRALEDRRAVERRAAERRAQEQGAA